MTPILQSKVFISIIAAWLITQLIKLIWSSVKKKSFDWKVFFLPGGMPSGHAAFTAALATAIYIEQKASPLFVAVLAFALLVMYDAMTLRREVGMHKGLLEELFHKKIKTVLDKDHVGHTFLQVLIGALIGIAAALVVYFA